MKVDDILQCLGFGVIVQYDFSSKKNKDVENNIKSINL